MSQTGSSGSLGALYHPWAASNWKTRIRSTRVRAAKNQSFTARKCVICWISWVIHDF